jgi:hypothetical protein
MATKAMHALKLQHATHDTLRKNRIFLKHKLTIHKLPIKKGPRISSKPFYLNLALPTLPTRRQVSTLGAVDFTSVFGMGTGVSPQLYAPGNLEHI